MSRAEPAAATPRAPVSPTLAELQQQFFELVTAPQDIATELAARGLPPEALAAIIAGDTRASAVARLDIYANMYFFRILDVLRADYPKLAAVLGDEGFHNLATDYLQAHPSRQPSLRFVGAALPGFLDGHAFGQERPWIVELAALEWARVDVFDRIDETPLLRADLAAMEPESFATLPLKAIAACEVVPATFTVEEPWRALEHQAEHDGESTPDESTLIDDDGHEHNGASASEPEEPARADEAHALLVWRRGVDVRHRAVTGPERRALDLVRAGTTFGALCTALAGGLESDDADAAAGVAALAAQMLAQWLADELLAAV